MKQNKPNIIHNPIVIILVILLNLTFLYFIKYQNQNLPISAFSITSFGNCINLFFTLSLIVGILILVFKSGLSFETKIFLPILFINQIMLIIVYILKIISPPFDKIYYLGQTGDELLIGGIFAFYFFTILIMFFLVWLRIFKVKSLIFLRSLLNSAISMLLILLGVFLFVIVKETTFDDSSIGNNQANIGVVLGAAVWTGNKPSPSLASRVDKSIKLLEQNQISGIYLTGGNAPGELSEAEVAFNYIKSKGIITSQIFLEKETTSTNEQIQFIKQKLISNANENIVVISDSYHLVRVLEIARFHKLKILVSASALSQSFEKALYNNIRESLALTVFWLFAI